MGVPGSNRNGGGRPRPDRPDGGGGSGPAKPGRRGNAANRPRAGNSAKANGPARSNGSGAVGSGATGSATPMPGGVYQVTIPSDYDAGRDVQERIMDAVQRNGFDTDSTFAIRISLEEALVNAIKHGNRLDPRKKVRIEASVTYRRAEILIEDEGPGFDRSRIPNPTAEENLHRCSGRGILLIEAYMNRVEWSHGGRRLRMVKESEPR